MISELIFMKREEKIFYDTFWYALQAPFVFPNKWGDFPKSTLEQAKLYRLAEAVNLFDSKMCSDFEAMMYLSCVSHDAPLARQYYKMCMFCVKKYYGLEKINPDNDENLKWLDRDTILDESEQYEFNKLKSDIFKRQMGAMK